MFMHTFKKLSAAVALAVGFAVAAPALVHAETETTVTVTKKHHYIYYPEHQIYFAPEAKVYYWRSGDKWESGVTLPESSRAYVTTGGVELDLDVDRPYEKHEWVLAHYKDHRDHDD
jgi:hypothetical protein